MPAAAARTARPPKEAVTLPAPLFFAEAEDAAAPEEEDVPLGLELEVPVGVADAGGYDAPRALISNGSLTAYACKHGEVQ